MSLCPSCGFDNHGESNYCSKCGFEIYSATGRISPDTLLENRYLIVETIGRGGMGAVYKALDMRLKNTPVAVKEMSSSAVGKGKLNEAIDSFEKEAAMLVNLRHPALPRITDYFSCGQDRWYIVMDYIEGETLEAIVKRRGNIPEPELIDWTKQICDVLDYLHNQTPPVIFRDLKPSNIMLNINNEIKLIDFGIARHFKPDTTSDTSHYASLGFSPPEQYGQKQTDVRSDIYALGATMHYLLTGIDPGINPFKFKPPKEYGFGSHRINEVIMKAVEIDFEKRPNSIELISKYLTHQASVSPSKPVVDMAPQNETTAIPKTNKTMAMSNEQRKNVSKPKSLFFKIIFASVFITIVLSLAGTYYYYHYYPISGISLDVDSLVLEVGGDKVQLNVTFHPTYVKERDLVFSSGRTGCVSVTQSSGVVKPLKVGTDIITVKTIDGDHTATCDIEVVNPTIAWDGGTYFGEVENGIPHGSGEWSHSAGHKFIGTWKDGKWHGKGTYIHANGVAEKGYWENGLQNLNYIESIDAIFKGVKFFNEGDTWTRRDKRMYSNRFAKSEAHYICWQINLDFIDYISRTEKEFDVDVIYYFPNGNIFGRPSIQTRRYDSDISLGYGYTDGPGYWERGLYKAEFYIGGELIATEYFEIY